MNEFKQRKKRKIKLTDNDNNVIYPIIFNKYI